jgi:hypothetical protein
MDVKSVPVKFDAIRPLNDEEVKDVIEDLLSNPEFKHAVTYVLPTNYWDQFCAEMRTFRSKEAFKSHMAFKAVMSIAEKSTFSLEISGRSRLVPNKRYTFISNHRDIVLDAAFLNVKLYDVGQGLTQIAIGDNLLIRPWIEQLVRLNNSFLVKRGVTGRQMLEGSKLLSEYIHYTIKETNESVWIAQREGRSKDSNDYTQSSVVKMLNMGGAHKSIISNMIDLDIAPVAITYEFDPCDYLKAKEFQQKRDNPEFVKSTKDDLLNMEVGILGYKGRVHLSIATPINEVLLRLDAGMDKTAAVTAVSTAIDTAIFKNYRFYPGNYVAYDLRYGVDTFKAMYSEQEKEAFQEYLDKQMEKIVMEHKDETFLRTKLLEMYSNPLKNHLSVTPNI